ncbi:MAG: hypothetical protein PHC28_10340 [Flavobacterium sp.]|uniref:hypothetical protein n=1 Tax=Flavobacterium sp. TaxID=239 RepID=UPI0026388174|nr:hypothetical protein [Flavobacterium sp.]MDD5150856.1 hypothetical protein [Flavobacterium sp.]
MRNIKLSLILVFTLINFSFGQAIYTNKQIDSLIAVINYGNLKNYRATLQKMYFSSNHNNYLEGKCVTVLKKARLACEEGNYKFAHKYLDEGLALAEEKDVDSLRLFADIELAVLSGREGLNEKSVKLIESCFSRISKLQHFKNKEYYLGLLYTYKAMFSAGLKKQPTPKEYLEYHKKALFHFTKVKGTIAIPAYTNIGNSYLAAKEYDSAQYYYEKALHNRKKVKGFLAIEYANLGELCFELKKYPQALSYIDSSNVIAKKQRVYYLLENNYATQNKIYTELKDYANSYISLKLQLVYKDSVSQGESKIFKEGFSYYDSKAEANNTLFAINQSMLIIGFIIIASLLFCLYKSYVKILKNRALLKEKEKEINADKVQIVSLKQKITTSYEEVIVMAKKNNPLFFNSFKELYPDFYAKLIAMQSELTPTEQKVCFYLKLKFSTKEIADYTFVSAKAIQNRKNRLRKRLNIPERDDIYAWVDTI